MCSGKYVFVKMFTDELNMALPQWFWIEKTAPGEKHTDSFEDKVLGTVVLKKVMLTVFLDIKGHININFLEKDATVNF